MTKIKDTLPSKPSELLTLALADLAKVERSKRYEVDMTDWHVPINKNLCKVCLAGSVLAKSLNYPFNKNLGLHLLDDSIGGKLLALNNFRLGYTVNALTELSYGQDVLGKVMDVRVPEYAYDKKAWRKAMLKIVCDLKKLDL